MTDSQREPTAPVPLAPAPGILHLLPGDASAGYCADGVCHIPAPKAE